MIIIPDNLIRIYAQKVNSNGDKVWSPDGVAVRFIGASYIGNPKICGDGSGGCIMSWDDPRYTGMRDVYAQRIDSDGNVQWQNDGFPITLIPNSHQQESSMASDGLGAAYIVWQDQRDPNPGIYSQHVSDAFMLFIPNGGEFWEGGSQDTIRWIARNIQTLDHFTLTYSTDGGLTFPNVIESNLLNSGSYSWNVPNIVSINTRIKIQAFDSQSNLLTEDVSDGNLHIGKTTKTSFSFKQDNYNFSNDSLYNHIFEPLVTVLQESDLLSKFGSILLILSKLTSVGGNCLGMSISSAVYFVDPSKIPVSGKTTFQLSEEEAESNILWCLYKNF